MRKSNKKSRQKNKKLLKTLSEKITTPEMAYDIDEEDQNNNNSPKFEERKIDDTFDFRPSTQNKKIKESLISPNDPTNYQPEKLNSSKDDQIYPLNPSTPNDLIDIKLVKCKNHNKTYLRLDPKNFEIVCQKCLEEGYESQLEILDRPSILSTEENQFNCYMHNDSKGIFFCEECKEFICDMCFAETHREHKCHLPRIIKKKFVENLKEFIAYSSELNPILNNNINDIKTIYDNLKNQKNDTLQIHQNALKTINTNNEAQIDLLMKKCIEKFLGIDKEVNENYNIFNMLKEKTRRYLEILKKINDEVNNENKFEYDFYLCEYHKEKSDSLRQIFNFINSAYNFLNIRLNNTNIKFNENKEKIENSLNLVNKEVINYEKSSISSILTGRENRSIILRRFIHFSHNEIKYFKNTIIGIASNDNVFLSGLSLCGLFAKKKKTQNNQNFNNTISTINTNITNATNDTNNNEEIDNDVNKNKKIDIQITISTMINQSEGEKLFEEKCELGTAKGSEDAAVIINFEKGIKILKEKLYLIKIENLSENNYIDLWTGSVGKLRKKNVQVMRCHNTGIQFLFKQLEGIQSDFDEFDQGIIEGVLYSKNK